MQRGVLSMTLNFSILDLTMAAIILLLALRGALRGLILELSGLAAALLGFIVSGNTRIHIWAAGQIGVFLSDPAWGDFLAYIGIFIMVFILVSILFNLFDRLLAARAPNRTTRFLGALAGAVKGMCVCTLVLLCLRYVAPHSQIRRDSLLIPYINEFWTAVSRMTGGLQTLPDLGLLNL